MSLITTHAMDTRIGLPAVGLSVVLEAYRSPQGWQTIAEGKTGSDGRVFDLLEEGSLEEGLYRITFDTDGYFVEQEVDAFYPSVSINFQVADPSQHYHVPLLLSPFGYSTYRGS